MLLGTRNAARKILEEERCRVKMEMPVDRLTRILGKLRELSGLDVEQPVLLREDEDGLFALLPEEPVGIEYALCGCWCLGDAEGCKAYPKRSFDNSEEAFGEDAQKMLDFLSDKGYTRLNVVTKITKDMHVRRAQR